EAATVEQYHRLLTPVEPFSDCLKQAARENHLLAFSLILIAHVDDFDFRKSPVLDARRHRDVNILLRFRIPERLHRWSRGSQDNATTGKLGAHNCGIASVISR